MSYPQIKKCMFVDKDKPILYSFNKNDFSLSSFYFENMAIALSFFVFSIHEPSCSHHFFQYFGTFMGPIFFFLFLDLHVSIFLKVFAQPMSLLLNHIFRGRSLYFQNLEYLPNKHFFVYPQCRSRIFSGSRWKHVFAYSQCRSRMCMWSVRDLDLGSMINLSTRVNRT